MLNGGKAPTVTSTPAQEEFWNSKVIRGPEKTIEDVYRKLDELEKKIDALLEASGAELKQDPKPNGGWVDNREK